MIAEVTRRGGSEAELRALAISDTNALTEALKALGFTKMGALTLAQRLR